MKLLEEFKLFETMWDNKSSLSESTRSFYNANKTAQDYVDDVGTYEGGFTLIKNFWLPTNRGKLNVGLISLDSTHGEEGLVCIPSYDTQFVAPMNEAEDVYEMLYNAEAFDDMDAFIDKFIGCSSARSVERLLDSGVGHLIEGITNKVLTWTCFFDDKEIGTVEAATEDEALEKMMDKYPEYPYSKYDGCYYVNSGLNESISSKEIVAVLKDARETSEDFGINDEFTFEYYIGNAVSAAGYPMDSLFMFFPDHVSENDKEYKDAVRGWLENEGLDKNTKTSNESYDTKNLKESNGRTVFIDVTGSSYDFKNELVSAVKTDAIDTDSMDLHYVEDPLFADVLEAAKQDLNVYLYTLDDDYKYNCPELLQMPNVTVRKVATTRITESYRRTVSRGNTLADNELFVDFD